MLLPQKSMSAEQYELKLEKFCVDIDRPMLDLSDHMASMRDTMSLREKREKKAELD